MARRISVNGVAKAIDADDDTPVLWIIRDVLGLTGTKFGCGAGLCGACTVHIDGNATRSCVTSLASVAGKRVQTVEQLSASRVGSALQKAWLDLDVVQCGYCQSGQLMSAAALLRRNQAPNDADIDGAMSGNVCRCGTYARIREGIKLAARDLAGRTQRYQS